MGEGEDGDGDGEGKRGEKVKKSSSPSATVICSPRSPCVCCISPHEEISAFQHRDGRKVRSRFQIRFNSTVGTARPVACLTANSSLTVFTIHGNGVCNDNKGSLYRIIYRNAGLQSPCAPSAIRRKCFPFGRTIDFYEVTSADAFIGKGEEQGGEGRGNK